MQSALGLMDTRRTIPDWLHRVSCKDNGVGCFRGVDLGSLLPVKGNYNASSRHFDITLRPFSVPAWLQSKLHKDTVGFGVEELDWPERFSPTTHKLFTSVSETLQSLMESLFRRVEAAKVNQLHINSFPVHLQTGFPSFPCFHCYTVEGATTHLLKDYWIIGSKHRWRRSSNQWSQM